MKDTQLPLSLYSERIIPITSSLPLVDRKQTVSIPEAVSLQTFGSPVAESI